MPSLISVLSQEDIPAPAPLFGYNQQPYFAIIDAVQEKEGVGARVGLEADDKPRTVKRRLTLAAKARGFLLKWRQGIDHELMFVLEPKTEGDTSEPDDASSDELAREPVEEETQPATPMARPSRRRARATA